MSLRRFRVTIECYGDHRDLHLLTHSFPTLRSSDLGPLEHTCAFVQSKILNQSPDHRLFGLRTADQRKEYPLTAEALHRLAQLTVVALAIQTEITANVHSSSLIFHWAGMSPVVDDEIQ